MTTTVEDALAWLRLDADLMDPAEHGLFERVFDAVVEHIDRTYEVATDSAGDSPTGALAVFLTVARWWGRRDTPYGVIDIAESGAVRVTRLDPDVEAMLTRKVAFA